MYSICCSLPKPDFKEELTPDEFKRFCSLVNQYRKQGYSATDAQTRAFSDVLSEGIPFKAANTISHRQY